MPQASSRISSPNIYSKDLQADASIENGKQLQSVMTELNRLSKSFVNSYQTLESQVEKLNGQLKNETQEKHTALEEKQRLLIEKASLSDRLQSLLAVLPAGIVVIDGAGKVKDCNAVAVDILGRPLLGQLWIKVINRAFQPQADDGHQISLKDGRKIHIETRALDNEPGQLIVMTDLTKTRQLQSELSQQQKLSSMGKMIASLAHQIRTPLSTAILYGSHLNNQGLAPELKQEFSHHLMERLHYMDRQVTDMLNFVKGERKQKDILSVAVLFEKFKAMELSFPQVIKFSLLNNSDSNPEIFGDEDALMGALSNLLENACDACESIAQPNIIVSFEVTNELKIRVCDNGTGISQLHQKKIFEPFFTKKRNGNGLGLAVVHGVVIEHKGTVTVTSDESSDRQGTQFEICLPLAQLSGASEHAMQNQQEKVHEF